MGASHPPGRVQAASSKPGKPPPFSARPRWLALCLTLCPALCLTRTGRIAAYPLVDVPHLG
jgi:hypothetical protein